jgi:hypothetical protein
MQSPSPATHATHDLELIAAHAAGDLDPAGARRAANLLADCAECRTLAADLASLAAATRALPPSVRERDFRISAETAARLRGTSPIRRLRDGLLAPRGFGRPLAGALMTLGLAGLMVASIPAWLTGASPTSTASGGRDSVAPLSGDAAGEGNSAPEYVGPTGGQDGIKKDGITGPATPGTSPVPAVKPEPAPSGAVGPGDAVAPPQTAVDGSGAGSSSDGSEAGDRSAERVSPGAGGSPSPLAIGSAVLLVAGLTLLVLRRLRRPDPGRRSG